MASILEAEAGYSQDMLMSEGELKRKELLERIDNELKFYG